MKKLLFLSIFVMAFSGCKEEEVDGFRIPEYAFLRSYVMHYFYADKLSLSESIYKYIDAVKVINLSLYGHYSSGRCGYNSTGEEKEVYDALCEKHNDMTFNREMLLLDGGGSKFHTSCWDVDFVSIDIVSNATFDAEHPAGASLGDIVLFRAYSYRSYIDSGYSGDEVDIISELLSEITPDKFVLLDANGIQLRFPSAPTLSKTHTFTVTVTLDDGRVLTDTVEITFD